MIDDAYWVDADFSAVTSVLQQWQQQWPGMGVLVLLPEARREQVAAIQATARVLNVPLVGAVFPALLSERGFMTEGAWLMRFNQMPPTLLLDSLDGPAVVAARRLTSAVTAALNQGERGVRGGTPTLFMIFDGMLSSIGSCLAEVFGQLGQSVRYAGVNAGSETFQPMPCLFDRDRILENGVLGLLLPDAATVVVRHGYPIKRGEMTATSTQGNRIERINGRPAFEVYQEVIAEHYGIALTPQNFYDYGVHYPFGLVTAIDVLVRIPVAMAEDGSLFCVGEVPPDSRLWLLQAPQLADSTCMAELSGALHTEVATPLNRCLPTFYCAGRRMHFGLEVATEEVAAIQVATGATTLCGALSLGEIDSMDDFGFPRFHNACVVCAP